MKKQRVFVATVSLVIPVPKDEGQAYACDAVSACLSENLKERGAILDWAYLRLGKEYVLPHEQIEDKKYVEGSFDMATLIP